MIPGALSVALVLALAGDPPEAPAAPDVAPPAAEPAPAAPAEAPAPAAAPAAPPTPYVAILRPPAGDPLLEEASSRIRSELAASGFEGRLVACPEPTETRIPCPGPEANATIALGRDDGVVQLDVRAILPDGLELSRHVRVLDRDGGQDPSVLAVRAVEVLRDLRLNARRRAPQEPPRPAVDGEEPKIPVPPPPPPRWWLSTGLGVLAAPRTNEPGIGPALGATLAAGMILGPRSAGVLTFAGPFNSTFDGAPNGQASLIQALATLELRYRFFAGITQPFIAAQTGINFLRADVPGANPPISTAWVPLFGVGGGITCDLGHRFSVGAEAEIFATAPNELVEATDTSKSPPVTSILARTGAPSILFTADVNLRLP